MTLWCWVRSTTTGHHFDIPIARLDRLEAIGAVVEIPGRRRFARDARPPKPLRPLGWRRSGRAPADTRRKQ